VASAEGLPSCRRFPEGPNAKRNVFGEALRTEPQAVQSSWPVAVAAGVGSFQQHVVGSAPADHPVGARTGASIGGAAGG